MVQWWYSGVTVGLQWCHESSLGMLQLLHRDPVMLPPMRVLHGCHMDVTFVSHGCYIYSGVIGVSQGCHNCYNEIW
jgi:hypothetical protein